MKLSIFEGGKWLCRVHFFDLNENYLHKLFGKPAFQLGDDGGDVDENADSVQRGKMALRGVHFFDLNENDRKWFNTLGGRFDESDDFRFGVFRLGAMSLGKTRFVLDRFVLEIISTCLQILKNEC